jgi:hypothetical protein
MGPLYPVEHLGPPTEIIDLSNQGEYSDVELAAERILDFVSVFGFCSKRYAWLLNICQKAEVDKMTQVQRQLAESLKNAKNKNPENCQTLEHQALQDLERLIVISYMTFNGLNPSDKAMDSLFSDNDLDSIISTDTNFWPQVWTEVAARQASLPRMEVKHEEISKRSFSHGIGSREAAERMDKVLGELGAGLKPGAWRTMHAGKGEIMELKQNIELEETGKITINIPEGTVGPVTVNLNLSFRERMREHLANQGDGEPGRKRHLHLVKSVGPARE